jgi:hypothetical protein
MTRHAEGEKLFRLFGKLKTLTIFVWRGFFNLSKPDCLLVVDLVAGAARVHSHVGEGAAEEQKTRQGAGMPAEPVVGHAKEPPRQVVLVWDLDETLILFHSLINGDYDAAMGTPPEVRLLPPVSLCGLWWGGGIQGRAPG